LLAVSSDGRVKQKQQQQTKKGAFVHN
jgi:hypothetical protein